MKYKIIFNIIKNFQWRNLFLKLWKYVALAVSVPTVVFAIVFINSHNDTMYKKIENMFALSSHKSAQSFKRYVDEFYEISTELVDAEEVIAFLEKERSQINGAEYSVNQSVIYSFLEKYIVENEILDSVYLYSFKNSYMVSSRIDGYAISESASKLPDEWQETQLINKCLENNKKCNIFKNRMQISDSAGNKTEKDLITIAFPLHTTSYKIVSGIIIFNLNVELLRNELAFNSVDSNFFVVQKDKEIISLNDDYSENDIKTMEYDNYTALSNKIMQNEYILDKRKENTYCSIAYEDVDMIMIFSTNTASIKQLLPYMLPVVIIVLFIGIIAMLFLSYIVSMIICNFVIEIIYELGANSPQEKNEFKDKDYIRQKFLLNIDQNSEIQRELVSKIKQLKEAQVFALQTQINPHFIFNSLNLVNLMIINTLKGDCPASRVVSLLSDILHYSFDTEEFTTTFEEELYYVHKYIEIEQMKCANKFEFNSEVDDSVLQIRTVKFSLQPILENCISHAFGDLNVCEGEIKFSISRRDDKVLIRIKDNGPGVDEKKIKELNEGFYNIENLKRGRHIGLANVNHRFKIIFGEEASMKVYNDTDGFVVEILQPFE